MLADILLYAITVRTAYLHFNGLGDYRLSKQILGISFVLVNGEIPSHCFFIHYFAILSDLDRHKNIIAYYGFLLGLNLLTKPIFVRWVTRLGLE